MPRAEHQSVPYSLLQGNYASPRRGERLGSDQWRNVISKFRLVSQSWVTLLTEHFASLRSASPVTPAVIEKCEPLPASCSETRWATLLYRAENDFVLRPEPVYAHHELGVSGCHQRSNPTNPTSASQAAAAVNKPRMASAV